MRRFLSRLLGPAILLTALFALGACTSSSHSAKAVEALETTTIYLVRHAEKANGSRDPELNAAGLQRANRLAEVLEQITVDKLWSSDYIRTRQTLAPLSRQKGVPLEVYDARDSKGLVLTILEGERGQTHVIAGHSNTVPALVDLLQAWPAEPDSSAMRPNLGHEEYDRLYVVTLVSGQLARVVERRY